MYAFVLQLLSPFQVEMYRIIYTMERGIYSSGVKTKPWAKFNMLLLQ